MNKKLINISNSLYSDILTAGKITKKLDIEVSTSFKKNKMELIKPFIHGFKEGSYIPDYGYGIFHTHPYDEESGHSYSHGDLYNILKYNWDISMLYNPYYKTLWLITKTNNSQKLNDKNCKYLNLLQQVVDDNDNFNFWTSKRDNLGREHMAIAICNFCKFNIYTCINSKKLVNINNKYRFDTKYMTEKWYKDIFLNAGFKSPNPK